MKEIKWPNPGRYVLAVSGGVDSVVLLHEMAAQKEYELVAAHFNHAMRTGSVEDEEFTRQLAKGYGLILESSKAAAGVLKSEDDARKARYEFLEKIRRKHRAEAILTAHHQDDLIETALINVLRGTGRKGLSAMALNPKIVRPLIDVPKKEIYAYAKATKLTWVEDPTNARNNYLRNYLRNRVLREMTGEQRQSFVKNLQNVAKINNEVDEIIATISRIVIKNNTINRLEFANLPVEAGYEVLAHWLRSYKYSDFDKKSLRQIANTVKTAKAGTRQPIRGTLQLRFTRDKAIIETTDSNY